MAVFEISFSMRKVFLGKKISGEISFALISLFSCAKLQEIASRSTAIRSFVFLAKYAEFYHHKIFEARSQ